ncbi:uncharacterized protein LOC110258089 [Sus scrofa]|uniref:uncharacterized protein LOC110258089 n=1 Tax=Sus scrofa TaxID=9823 RepID=UPI000A2B631E|nr:uncharacterized protein LOC110258089 [Sus scrofa]
MRGGVASDSSAQVHPLRLRRTGRGAGGVREVVSPGGNVMGRAPDTHVPTHAQGKRRVPGAQGRPRAGGREALSVSGRAEGREESPTVAAEGRFYGSHAGPNAAGRRAREPLALRGSPERGRLRVRAAPSAPCGRPAPGAPRDRRPRGSGRRRGEGTR